MADPQIGVLDGTADTMAVRRAMVRDVPAMAGLINHFAEKGEMLARSQHQLYQTVRDFWVITVAGQLVACGALHVVWEDIGEVRSLAVTEAWQGKGLGRRLVASLLDEARALGLPRVFSLTYRRDFFERMGFRITLHESLPHKIWADCLNCLKFPNCDEIAMIIDLNPQEEDSHEEYRE